MPNTFKSAWIIDGQHRLLSYFHPDTDQKFRERQQLSIVAFENLDHEDEAQMFVDINHQQVGVPKALLLQIRADLDLDSGDAKAVLDAIATKVFLQMNEERPSPLFGLITSEQAGEDDANIALPQLVDALRKTNLIGVVQPKTKTINWGPLGGKDPMATVSRSVQVLSRFFEYFSSHAASHWALRNSTNRSDRPGGHLSTSRGAASLILLLADLTKYIEANTGEPFDNNAPSHFVDRLKLYCSPVATFFEQPSYEDISLFKVHRGSTAFTMGMREMQIIIQRHEPTYKPEGLAAYMEDRQEREVDSLSKLYRPLESDLLTIVIAFVKREYGESTDGWFIQGVPPEVKDRILKVKEKTDKELEECWTMPIDAKIVIQKNITANAGRTRGRSGSTLAWTRTASAAAST